MKQPKVGDWVKYLGCSGLVYMGEIVEDRVDDRGHSYLVIGVGMRASLKAPCILEVRSPAQEASHE
jgi:hypothetical protein